jgi:F-type H+-transporting ATPase subunit b
MHFDWWTLGLQAANFVVLVWVLQRFLYKPIADAVERRRREAEASFAEADAVRHQAEEEIRSSKAKAQEIEHEQGNLLRLAREAGAAEAEEIREGARREAADLLDAARKQLAAERQELGGEVHAEAARVAVKLAESLLRQMVRPPLVEGFLVGLEERIAAMSAAERAGLRGHDSHPIEVRLVTAPAIENDSQEKWRARFAKQLGDGVQITFARDDGLIAGVRMEFPTAVLEFSWARALADAELDLTKNAPSA